MNPDAIPRDLVYSTLRRNLPYLAVACVIAISGVCSLLLAKLRARDRLLLYVGAFSILYAGRLFVQNELVRDAFDAPGSGYVPFALCITYAINIPFSLFALELFGHGWKSSIRVWVWLCSALAAIAIPVTLVAHPQHWMDVGNSTLVVGGTLLVLFHVFTARDRSNLLAASLIWPLLLFGLFVILENNGFRIHGLSIEPVGFLILLAGFASVALRRALATQKKLVDVEQELSTARRIQLSILPASRPQFQGVDIALRFMPMTSVAGDFYDFLVSDDILTILVADVSGHGVPAALVACMLKVCFAAQRITRQIPQRFFRALEQCFVAASAANT